MNIKKYLGLLCLISVAISIKANPLYIDSLHKSLYNSTNMHERTAALKELCENARMIPLDSFKKYVDALNSISNENKSIEDRLYADYYKSLWCIRTGRTDSFLYYFTKNEKASKTYPKVQLRYLNMSGVYFIKKNKHKDAFKQYYEVLKLAEAQKDTQYIVISKSGIGWVHMEMNQIEEALQWFRDALNVTDKNRYQKNYPSILINMASCYGAIGKFDSSNEYCNKALDLSISNHDLLSEANASFIKGNLYMVENNYLDAERVFMEGYRIHQQIGDPFYIVSDMAQIAIHYANTKQYEKGIRMASDAISYAKEHKLDAKLIMCYDALAINYKNAKQFEEYGKILLLMNQLKDSVYQKTSELAVAEMNTKYETEKKEKIIQKQQFEISKRNGYLIGGIILFALSMLLGVALYRNRIHKQEREMQQQLMVQQDLASKSVIEAEENERKRIAADLHDGVGQMLSAVKLNLEGLTDRVVFDDKHDKEVYEKVKIMLEDSCKEVRNVSHNIMPNALLKSGLGNAVKDFIEKINSKKLNIQVSATGIEISLPSNIEIVVYRVIQECVNNVIKHASASKLDISIIQEANGLAVTIEDNGKGFDVKHALEANGIGLKNIKTRIEFLKGTLDIDSKPGNGTLVAFHIPV